jgi:hypothetical protein
VHHLADRWEGQQPLSQDACPHLSCFVPLPRMQLRCPPNSAGFSTAFAGAFDLANFDVATRPRYSPSYLQLYCEGRIAVGSSYPPYITPLWFGRLGATTQW